MGRRGRRPLRLDGLILIIYSHFAINTAIIGYIINTIIVGVDVLDDPIQRQTNFLKTPINPNLAHNVRTHFVGATIGRPFFLVVFLGRQNVSTHIYKNTYSTPFAIPKFASTVKAKGTQTCALFHYLISLLERITVSPFFS